MRLELTGKGKENEISLLEEKAKRCKLCPLALILGSDYGTAFWDGSFNAKMMLLGEAPGKDECIAGKPFVGRAGKLLNNILQYGGFSREDFYITNICKHRPPSNRPPTAEESYVCVKHFLLDEINTINPQIVVPVGNTPTQFLLGKDRRITQARGNWFSDGKRLIFPMFHPSYLLRNTSILEGSPRSLTSLDILALRSKAEELNLV